MGAHNYLALREQLQEHGERLSREDYVAIVERVLGKFVEGVASNVRTRVLSNLSDAIAIANGEDDAYADCVSRILYETFYGTRSTNPTLQPALRHAERHGVPLKRLGW